MEPEAQISNVEQKSENIQPQEASSSSNLLQTENVSESNENNNTTTSPSAEEIQLPSSVSILQDQRGYTVYVVGTAHVSQESVEDVRKVIELTKPGIVMVELCNSRKSLLVTPPEYVTEKQKTTSFWSLAQTCFTQSNSIRSGFLRLLITYFTMTVSRKLDLAPGAEFREAYQAAKTSDAKVVLGDRPVEITLHRTWASLSFFEKIKFLIRIIKESRAEITKEDIEKLKETDMLTELLAQFGTHFPKMTEILIDERDAYMAHSIRACLRLLRSENKKIRKELKVKRLLQLAIQQHLQKQQEQQNQEQQEGSVLGKIEQDMLSTLDESSASTTTAQIPEMMSEQLPSNSTLLTDSAVNLNHSYTSVTEDEDLTNSITLSSPVLESTPKIKLAPQEASAVHDLPLGSNLENPNPENATKVVADLSQHREAMFSTPLSPRGETPSEDNVLDSESTEETLLRSLETNFESVASFVEKMPERKENTVIVAVVGMGHVAGMKKYFTNPEKINLRKIMHKPPVKFFSSMVKFLFFAVFMVLVAVNTVKYFMGATNEGSLENVVESITNSTAS